MIGADVTVDDWLLDSDPSITWQVMRDLVDKPSDSVAAERARVAREGWGARLLALQRPDGHWGDDLSNPEWITHWALVRLRDMGLDPTSAEALRAVARVKDNITWHWWTSASSRARSSRASTDASSPSARISARTCGPS